MSRRHSSVSTRSPIKRSFFSDKFQTLRNYIWLLRLLYQGVGIYQQHTDQIERKIKENPLMALGITFCVGYLIGKRIRK